MAWFKLRNRKAGSGGPIDLDGLKSMRWPEFEGIVAQAFRQRGYTVEITGKGGLEGDIDLILGKQGRTELVQCKQWKMLQVGIATVREMWGVVNHRKADGLKIVSAGAFTDEARDFARDKAIDLIDGPRLLDLARTVQPASPKLSPSDAAPSPPADTQPICPACGSTMFKRYSRQTNQMFWSCIRYPGCKGTVPV